MLAFVKTAIVTARHAVHQRHFKAGKKATNKQKTSAGKVRMCPFSKGCMITARFAKQTELDI
jgi:hypothetical protein